MCYPSSLNINTDVWIQCEESNYYVSILSILVNTEVEIWYYLHVLCTLEQMVHNGYSHWLDLQSSPFYFNNKEQCHVKQFTFEWFSFVSKEYTFRWLSLRSYFLKYLIEYSLDTLNTRFGPKMSESYLSHCRCCFFVIYMQYDLYETI